MYQKTSWMLFVADVMKKFLGNCPSISGYSDYIWVKRINLKNLEKESIFSDTHLGQENSERERWSRFHSRHWPVKGQDLESVRLSVFLMTHVITTVIRTDDVKRVSCFWTISVFGEAGRCLQSEWYSKRERERETRMTEWPSNGFTFTFYSFFSWLRSCLRLDLIKLEREREKLSCLFMIIRRVKNGRLNTKSSQVASSSSFLSLFTVPLY